MSIPSSPASSSGSDDFAALLDAELQSLSSSRDSFAAAEEDDDDDDDDDDAEEVDDKENVPHLFLESTRKRKEIDFPPRNSLETKLAKDDATGSTSETTAGSCPPHPGFMWGVCIRCGALKAPSEPGDVGVALRYIHEGLELTEREAARMRRDELKQIVAKKKLYLVLDLDHTMLNSARFVELPAEEQSFLISTFFGRKSFNKELDGSHLPRPEKAVSNDGSLYRLENLHMWTKLRPFAHKFLEEASEMFEMYVYTMGERMYALAMAQLLDPKGRYFGSRVISQSDSTRRHMKDLDIMLGADSAVVILDDTEGVWPKHKANLLLMERYHFFSSSCKQFGIQSASLVEARQDESEEDGTLANMLSILQSVHAAFFDAETLEVERSPKVKDVREVIKRLRSRVLAGCKVVFSRVFPMSIPNPEANPFWRLTEELGAVCTNKLDSSVTHVIAMDKGTDKARWALKHGIHLVHPRWVDAALYTWKRPREEDYPVGFEQVRRDFMTLSKTVNIKPLMKECSVNVDPAAINKGSLAEVLDGEQTVDGDSVMKNLDPVVESSK